MGKSQVFIPCRHCGGRGRVELTGVYAETLDFLNRQIREISGADMARIVGIKMTAMENRLVALERLGLASGRRFGRQRLWKSVKLEAK